MKVLTGIFLFAASLTTLSAQSALVRVVHASPTSPAVDVTINGQTALENIPYRGYTAYNPVPAGTYQLGIKVAGTNTFVYQSTESLSAGVSYTFIAAGDVSKGTFRVIGVGDDLSDPGDGNVRFRVVHAASTAPAVDVYATLPYVALAASTPILTNVPFGIGSGNFVVPSGIYQARVAVAGTKTVAISSGPLALTNRAVRTIIAVDPSDANSSFELLVLPDRN